MTKPSKASYAREAANFAYFETIASGYPHTVARHNAYNAAKDAGSRNITRDADAAAEHYAQNTDERTKLVHDLEYRRKIYHITERTDRADANREALAQAEAALKAYDAQHGTGEQPTDAEAQAEAEQPTGLAAAAAQATEAPIATSAAEFAELNDAQVDDAQAELDAARAELQATLERINITEEAIEALTASTHPERTAALLDQERHRDQLKTDALNLFEKISHLAQRARISTSEPAQPARATGTLYEQIAEHVYTDARYKGATPAGAWNAAVEAQVGHGARRQRAEKNASRAEERYRPSAPIEIEPEIELALFEAVCTAYTAARINGAEHFAAHRAAYHAAAEIAGLSGQHRIHAANAAARHYDKIQIALQHAGHAGTEHALNIADAYTILGDATERPEIRQAARQALLATYRLAITSPTPQRKIDELTAYIHLHRLQYYHGDWQQRLAADAAAEIAAL